MQRRGLGLLALIALAAIGIAACGGGDDEDSATPDAGATEAADNVGAASPTATDDLASEAASSGDDLTSRILGDIFALPPNFISDAERDCMNEELGSVYPDGLPENITITDELLNAIDAAAVTCEVAGIPSP